MSSLTVSPYNKIPINQSTLSGVKIDPTNLSNFQKKTMNDIESNSLPEKLSSPRILRELEIILGTLLLKFQQWAPYVLAFFMLSLGTILGFKLCFHFPSSSKK